MLGGRMAVVRGQAAAASEFAARLVRDEKFRKHVMGAAKHASRARQRALRQTGFANLVARVAADTQLLAEVQQMSEDLQAARERLQRLQAKPTRGHHLRNTLLLAGLGGVALRCASAVHRCRGSAEA